MQSKELTQDINNMKGEWAMKLLSEGTLLRLLSAGTKKNGLFELSAEPGSTELVAESFSNWNPTANPLKDNPGSGHFNASESLPTMTGKNPTEKGRV